MTGAAITDPAHAEPFIAAGAAVEFWYFFPTEKGLGPRGYERNEIIKSLIRSSLGFSLVFISLGATATFIGSFLLHNSQILYYNCQNFYLKN